MHKVVTSSSGSTSLLPQQTITVWVVGYAGQRTRSTGGQWLITNGARKLAPNHQEAPWGPSVVHRCWPPSIILEPPHCALDFMYHPRPPWVPRAWNAFWWPLNFLMWRFTSVPAVEGKSNWHFQSFPHLYRAAIAVVWQAGVWDVIQSNISLAPLLPRS